MFLRAIQAHLASRNNVTPVTSARKGTWADNLSQCDLLLEKLIKIRAAMLFFAYQFFPKSIFLL
jgi:hypothetical protein